MPRRRSDRGPRPADEPSDPSRERDRQTERFACHVARLLDDSRCEQVRVLDLRGLSPVADFFVLATGTSDRQIQSVSEDVALLGQEEGQGTPSNDASGGHGWVVADFFDTVVHLFSPELRAYYDLDSLWSDARQVDWRGVTKPGQFAKMGSQSARGRRRAE